MRRSLLLLVIFFQTAFTTFAQYNAPLYLRATERAERDKMHERIIQNIILKNLETPLSDETEENWQAAFQAMEVIGYHTPFTWQKMQEALQSAPFQSVTFQRHMLEAAFTIFPGNFVHEVNALLRNTNDAKIFAMCAVYLLKSKQDKNRILSTMKNNFSDSDLNHPILLMLSKQIQEDEKPYAIPQNILSELVSAKFLPGETVMYSFQRKNRDYPGIVMVRNRAGNFIKDSAGDYFNVPQLARGIAGLPFFLTKGNTPQGIYKMFGFGISGSQFIGPTANIQMGLPVELPKNKFFISTKSAEWSIEDYKSLLPPSIKDFEPIYEAWYAGLAGRNEIIAHGTTIDPELYKDQPYYPMTPTEGCLCTKELWNGKLVYSDQQKLVSALLRAGGAYGYVLVIDIDDQHKPVTVEELKTYLR